MTYYEWMQQFKDDDTREGILARNLSPTDSIRNITECAGELAMDVYFRTFRKWYETCRPRQKQYEQDLKDCAL